MIYNFKKFKPEIDETAYIHNSAQIIGRVKIEKDVSIWPNAVIRADVEKIVIKEKSNIQDCAVLHPDKGKPVIIGKGVTVGHSALVHGSNIKDYCLIGMGSIVINSEVGEYSLIAAGALIPPGNKIPPYSLVMGLPFKIIRKLTKQEIKSLEKSAMVYVELAKNYKI